MTPFERMANPFEAFSGHLEVTHFDAAQRASANFMRYFPGWPLYARIVRGDHIHDRQLQAWAIMCARTLARATKRNGREYIAGSTRGPWVAQAGLDALDFAFFGKYAEGLAARAERFGVSNKPYQKIRDVTALCIWRGFESYADELHRQYRKVIVQEKYSS